MGQIKNIKLHIVTDIKVSNQIIEQSHGSGEGRRTNCHWLSFNTQDSSLTSDKRRFLSDVNDMDVRKLLLLAVDNSNIAKKKAARLDRDDDDDEVGVSNDAVAEYLAKKEKIKAKIKAQEEESKRKRIEARLNASLEKPT